jgi:hypothetical protein
MSNELSVLNELFAGENALSTQSASELRELDAMSNATSFLQRLQLYSKGKSGPNGTLIEGGHYGVPKSGEDIEDLGNSIDVLVIDRKAKAIDMSDTDNIIVSNDTKSDEFKRIVDMADNVKDSGCAYGPTYLVYERSTRQFYEFFCGNKSGRYESSKINTYLPVTQAMIEAGVTKETEPRFSKPMTLKSQYVKKGKWEWFAPKAEDSLTPIDLPPADQLRSEIERFRKIEAPEVETVDDSKKSKRSR